METDHHLDTRKEKREESHELQRIQESHAVGGHIGSGATDPTTTTPTRQANATVNASTQTEVDPVVDATGAESGQEPSILDTAIDSAKLTILSPVTHTGTHEEQSDAGGLRQLRRLSRHDTEERIGG
jgi:septal ring-binding cell division protein DamX